MRQIPRLGLALLLLLPLVWAAGVGEAAAATLTGTLRGKVTDEKGEALPGVTIIMRSDALIRERTTTTDAAGNYFVPSLPPGDYRVVAQVQGYVTMAMDTEVSLDETTDLPITMKSGSINETVTVTSSKPIVDKTSTEVSTLITQETVAPLPILRQYQSLLTMAPGVVDTDGSGNPNMGGGTANSNEYLVDGVSGRDPVTGTFGFNLNYDAIEAVDVKLAGVSAEYGQFQGGLANVLTKSGSNEFTGSVRDEIDSAAWTQTYKQSTLDLFLTPPDGGIPPRGPADKKNDIQITLGGPVVRDSAWFFISYSRPETVRLETLGNPLGGPFENGTYVRTFQGDFSQGKLTWQATNNHKLQGQYTEDPANVPVCYGRVFFGGPCYDAFNVDLQSQGGNLWFGEWSATWSPRFLSTIKAGHYEGAFAIKSLAPRGAESPPIFESPGGLGSGAAAGPGAYIDLGSGTLLDATIFDDTPEDRKRDLLDASATAFFEGLGSHTAKIGLDYQEQERIGSSIIAGNALYLGVGFVNDPPGIGAGGTGDPYDVNNRFYYVWYDFAPPTDAGPKTTSAALYVQDDWSVNDNLSLNLGVRYEDSQNENDLGEEIVGDKGFAPRLGATYDITGEGKMLIKATAARYLAGINLTTLSPFVRAAGGQSSYDIYFDVDPGPGIPDWLLIGQVRPDPETSQFAADLKPQHFDEFTVGYEHSFTPTIGAKLRYLDREYDNIITSNFSWNYDTGTPRKILLFDNNPNATHTYKAIIVELEKRFAHNFSLLANYTRGESEGNVTNEHGFDTFGSYPGVPQVTENRFGFLPWDLKHLGKLFGEYRLPLKSARHSLGIGAAYQYFSGNAFASRLSNARVIVGPGPDGVQQNPLGTNFSDAAASDDQSDQVIQFFEPRGSRRDPDWWRLDTSLNYQFRFSKRVQFETRFLVYNVTNEQDPVIVSIDPDSAGFPTSYDDLQTPRRYNVQFAVTW